MVSIQFDYLSLTIPAFLSRYVGVSCDSVSRLDLAAAATLRNFGSSLSDFGSSLSGILSFG